MRYAQKRVSIKTHIQQAKAHNKKSQRYWHHCHITGIHYFVVDFSRSVAIRLKCSCIFRSPAAASFVLKASRII